MRSDFLPLIMLKKGQEALLKEINSGAKLKKKLNDMGLTPGVKINVISASGSGPVILDVRGSRLALGRGIVSKVVVDLI